MMKTALTACRLALVIFVVPYLFVYNNALLLVGNFGQIVMVCITAPLGVWVLACAAQNHFGGRLPVYLRAVLLVGGGCLIYPGWATDLLGMVIVTALVGARMPGLFRRFTLDLLKRKAPDVVAGSK